MSEVFMAAEGQGSVCRIRGGCHGTKNASEIRSQGRLSISLWTTSVSLITLGIVSRRNFRFGRRYGSPWTWIASCSLLRVPWPTRRTQTYELGRPVIAHLPLTCSDNPSKIPTIAPGNTALNTNANEFLAIHIVKDFFELGYSANGTIHT